MTRLVDINEAVAAAPAGALLIDRGSLGLLKFTGATRQDLIHRMSTQVVNGLTAGQGTATILTSDIARMIDRLRLYVGEDFVYAVTGEQNGDAIARYLMRFVFFNDDFHIADLSAATAVLGVYGGGARPGLARALGIDPDWPLHHWRPLTWQGTTLSLHRTDPVAGDGYLLLCPAGSQSALWQALVEGGLLPAGEDAFDYLRIAAGQPRFGREITSDYIPLEANLWADVSFAKGCYIGQEIIARMESRGRLAKRLVRLRPHAPVTAGSEIVAGDRPAGVITSAMDGPLGPVALGYIKTAILAAEEPAALTSDGIPLTLLAGD